MKFKSDYKKGMAKEATQHITVEQILKTFEENHIACMPLKGYLVKYLYPQPDMRLSFAAQVSYYTTLIRENGDWELVDIYADEGVTGLRMDKREDSRV